MKQQIFRKSALERLSSPEQLDTLLRVTSRRAWLVLGGIGILLLAILGWGILGRVPTNLNSQQCILVKNGGVNVITSVAAGRLTDLSVERGDTVTRGQIIGRIEQSDMLQKISATEARLKEVQTNYAQSVALAQRGTTLQASSMAQQLQTLRSQLDAATRKMKLLSDRLDSQNSLFAQGLITQQTVTATQLELSAAQLESENIHTQFKQLEIKQMDEKKLRDNEVVQAKNQVDDVVRTHRLMLREAKNSMLAVSPYTGKVLEVKVSEGQLVDRGTKILSVEASGSNLNDIQAFIYLPAGDGKRIKSGMNADISPSTVKREEYGFLPGYISSVAEYPSTDEGLMRVFANEQVVKQLSGTNAPIQIVANLKPSNLNVSSYEWSTRGGPPFTIQSGTLCTASITVSERSPVQLVLPILKKFISSK
jgi:HlyD family secretion protein